MKRIVFAIAGAVVGAAGLHGAAAQPDPDTSDAWRRGAALAQAIGPCASCHSPAGEGDDYTGARVDDWYAPALSDPSDARLPWTVEELYAFLRTGSSPLHGIAVGPMSEVVHDQLAVLPDEDIEALAIYFASRAGAPETIGTDEIAAAMEPAPGQAVGFTPTRGAWLYVGYCVSCHFNRPEAQTGQRPELALNTAVSGADPSNLIRVMLRGVTEEEGDPYVHMPGFAMLLDDHDVADVARYLRAAYAPDEEPWRDVEARVAEIRALNDAMQ